MYSIEVRGASGTLLARTEGEKDARLVYRAEYRPGDRIIFTASQRYAEVSVDQAVASAPVFLPEKGFAFDIPFGDPKVGYPHQAFTGDVHAITVGPVFPDMLCAERNIALNPFDQHEASGCYPHATANVETRGEAQFFARNAIDGHRFNERHGGWPYHSWGIGERRDAWLKIDFGRQVAISAIALTLRADWPHDAWWEKGSIECSDGYQFTVDLAKTPDAQRFEIPERTVSWIILCDLVKADDPSPFPALTQCEVFGKDIME